MRPEEVRRLEAAVRAANPVPHTSRLGDTDSAAAVTLLVEQRSNAMATPTHTAAKPADQQPDARRKPAWAFAVGFVAILALIGSAVILVQPDEAPEAPPSGASPQMGTELLTIAGRPEGFAAVAWSPDGNHLAAAGRAIEGDAGVASVLDPETGDEMLRFELGNIETTVVRISYSPDGTRLAVGGPGASIFDAATGDELVGEVFEFQAFSPDGSRVAVGGAWGWAAVLDAATGDLLLELPGRSSWMWAAAWSPDGTRIVTTWGPDAKIWDAATGEELLTLIGHAGNRQPGLGRSTSGVQRVSWSPDGARLVTAGDDGTARIWDADTGEELAILTGHTEAVTDAAWSPDGTRIATASLDGTIKVWQAV